MKMVPQENPLPIYERLSYLIYAGALIALFCIVHEPDTSQSSPASQLHVAVQQIEPARDLPPNRRPMQEGTTDGRTSNGARIDGSNGANATTAPRQASFERHSIPTSILSPASAPTPLTTRDSSKLTSAKSASQLSQLKLPYKNRRSGMD